MLDGRGDRNTPEAVDTLLNVHRHFAMIATVQSRGQTRPKIVGGVVK
jgi:hypothetical protein